MPDVVSIILIELGSISLKYTYGSHVLPSLDACPNWAAIHLRNISIDAAIALAILL